MDFRGNPRFQRADGQRGIRFPNIPSQQGSPRVFPQGSPFMQNQSPNNLLAQVQNLRLGSLTPPQGPPPNIRLFNPANNLPLTVPPPQLPVWGTGAFQGIRQQFPGNGGPGQGPNLPNFQGLANLGNIASMLGPASNLQQSAQNFQEVLSLAAGSMNLQIPGSGPLNMMGNNPMRQAAQMFQNISSAASPPSSDQRHNSNQLNRSSHPASDSRGSRFNQSSSRLHQHVRENDRRSRERDRDKKEKTDTRREQSRNRPRVESEERRDSRDTRRGTERDREQSRDHNRGRDMDRSRDQNQGLDRFRDQSQSRSNRDRYPYESRRRHGNTSRSDRGDNSADNQRSHSRDRRYGNRDQSPRGTKRKDDGSYQSRNFKRRYIREHPDSPDSSQSSTPQKGGRESSVPSGMESTSQSEVPVESEPDTPAWIRCSPADLYFCRDHQTSCMMSTKKMQDLEERFETELVQRSLRINESRPKIEIPSRPSADHHHHHHSDSSSNSSSSSSDSDSDDDDDDETAAEEKTKEWMEALNRKKNHPYRLHEELWYNDPGEMNDGPVCRCSIKSKRTGIRHDKYPGEERISLCDGPSNCSNILYHYVITMSPPTNFLTKNPTIIEHDNHEYIFEGFSLFSHYKLENVPVCKVIRFNIEYTIHFFKETVPENFSVRSLDLFSQFLFTEILELVDLDWKGPGAEDNGCNRFHLMPRFARSLPDNGKEILSMNEVLLYLLRSSKPLLEETELAQMLKYEPHDWQNFVDEIRGMVVSYPGMKPNSLRIDQLDRQQSKQDVITYPLIIHFGLRPAQLSYAGDPMYQKMWKQYVKFKHLLNSKPKVTFTDKQKLEQKENFLQDLRTKSTMKREVTVEVSSEGFIRTGIKCDITQHAMLIPVLLGHLRFHQSLSVLENHLEYKFKDRSLLQLALTHTSYKVNYGTNPDHARNSLSNCGMRQLEYGDRKIHYAHTRKRGINILLNIMSRMGNKEESPSEIPHNERLEFLGDAVVEFISSVHLFFMFPWLEEGGLTTYRAAIVQNQQLAVLAKYLHLQDFMLYAHGPDLCHESDLKHAMANCFEALMGALYIDGGVDLADRIFSKTLFDEEGLLKTWKEMPLHPLQEEEPNGDRHWIESSPALQKLIKFEKSTGIEFNHIRLLARAFTLRSVGYNNLTLGHNQRLEFLGDTVLQLVASQYLFKHFPDHHEGHLSLLRSSLVNNRTQSIVCDDLNMSEYAIFAEMRGEKLEMKHKEKADLLEAFIGALFVDKELDFCEVFCNVCFFPRLKDFILNQDWNDPKSQLQQCCLTLRELDGGEPDIPLYKMIESIGPTNTRRYTVAVYFRDERLATGVGHSIQQAEMAAATNALNERSELFPILAHQKRFLERKQKRRKHQARRQGGVATTHHRSQKI